MPLIFRNNTYSFRFRHVYEYPDDGYNHIVSPWSDVASIGKASATRFRTAWKRREILPATRKYENGQPYFHFTCDIPESVEEANKLVKVWNALDWKIGSGSWATESGNYCLKRAAILCSIKWT